ncbi:TPA: hypothetical protein ACN98R_002190 [Vibrio parahaemolyticus]|nr:hypothetical protein CGK40_19980 [Vibrio parahaemolyticus]
MRGRPSRRSKKRDDAYFDAIKDGSTIKQAAEIAGYSYQSVMNYKRDDPEFAELHNIAIDYRFELYKEKAHEAMMHGFKEKQVITKDGKRTTIITSKENAAHVKFMLKAHEAGKFNYEKISGNKDESETEETTLDVTKLSTATLEELLNATTPDEE